MRIVERSRAALRVEHLPVVVVAVIYGLSALIVPLTSGAYWPLAVAPRIERAVSLQFSNDAISSLPIDGGTWVVQPWLTVLLLDGAERLGGSGALAALAGTLAALFGVLLYRIARRPAAPLFAAAVTLVVLPILFPLTLQGQLVASICAAGVVLALLSGRWWLAPLIIVIWTNAHGSAVIGAGICGMAYLGLLGVPRAAVPRRLPSLHVRKGRTIWIVVCGLCVLATPLGFGLVEYVRDVSSVPHLTELTPVWRPLHPFEWRFIAVVGATIVVGGALILGGEGKDRLRLTVPLVIFAAMTVNAERNIAWFGIVLCAALAVVVGREAARRNIDGELRSGIVGVSLVAVCLFGLVGLWPGTERQQDFSLAALPTGLLASLDNDSRVYASLEWADYVREISGASVYADARLERYSEDALRDYLDAIHGKAKGLDGALVCDRHDEPRYTHVLLREKTGHDLIARLEEFAADKGLRARELAANDDGVLFAISC